ncbi:MAG: radical SAM protein [Candidatus Omnitrophica bacterium]|nr:radical SAM protein [Candidatus Omnitrophota bacterium]
MKKGSLMNLAQRILPAFPGVVKHVPPPLKAVAIEPTNVCNLRCTICNSQCPSLYPVRKKGYMKWEEYKNIIDELAQLPHRISLGLNFGGEGLIHPEFCKMLEYAASLKKFNLGFHTNGLLLNSEVISTIMKTQVDRISISLDGLREKHEAIRVHSNFEKVEANIIHLLEARNQHGSKLNLSVNLTVSNHTDQEIEEFINYWVKRVSQVCIYPYETEDLEILQPENFFDQPTIQRNFCSNPFFYMAILWNGDVTTCCDDIAGRNFMGNVHKKGVRAIWKGKSYSQLRLAALKKEFHPKSACYKCDAWKKVFVENSRIIKGKDMKVTYSGLAKIYEHVSTVPAN